MLYVSFTIINECWLLVLCDSGNASLSLEIGLITFDGTLSQCINCWEMVSTVNLDSIQSSNESNSILLACWQFISWFDTFVLIILVIFCACITLNFSDKEWSHLDKIVSVIFGSNKTIDYPYWLGSFEIIWNMKIIKLDQLYFKSIKKMTIFSKCRTNKDDWW